MKLNYFNFKEFENKILMTNDFGNYMFVSPEDFKKIISKNFKLDSELGKQLQEKKMIYTDTNLEYSTFLMHLLRERKLHVNMTTTLHIFVVTTECNMRCVYCQANNGVNSQHLYMTKEMAENAVDIALQSPSKYLNFEFQGGEPLLNFDIIRHIVEYTEKHKGSHEIEYNIVTNLTLITDSMLDFFAENNFVISTSIDGPDYIHDKNRPFTDGSGTFEKVREAIKKIRERELHIGAIQTTTKSSLAYPREIVNTYKNLGFDSVFFRPLTPLGKALLNWDEIGYTPEEFLEFYTAALNEAIKINKNGDFFRENHATIFLGRITGKFVNYMELRSPCGAGIGQLAYYADGNIFTCDEGRMLHEMGDSTFRLGNVFESNYNEIINNGTCKATCASSILETIPSCCDCVYQPYCGTCPVVNYAKRQDLIEKEPRWYRCKIYSGMLDYLFKILLNEDSTVIDILMKWNN